MRNYIIKIVIILLSCSILLGTFICVDIVFRESSFTNKIISRIENKAKCKTMNGWWAVSGSSDMTITAPKVHWGDLNGTIELYRDQEISNKFTTYLFYHSK